MSWRTYPKRLSKGTASVKGMENDDRIEANVMQFFNNCNKILPDKFHVQKILSFRYTPNEDFEYTH